MTAKHIFENYCVNFEELLEKPSIAHMLKMADKQSKTKQAKKAVDLAHYKDYEEQEGAPMYFGLFVEWYAQVFLNHFGGFFNLGDVRMLNTEGSTDEDDGIDGEGKTLDSKKSVKTIIKAKMGCPVFIQVKGTLNPTKVYKANDGARLPNFMMNAATTAIARGQAYQARYVLFTTGKGVIYRLDRMSNGLMEVVAIDKIRNVGDNVNFLNVLRKQASLAPLNWPQPQIDAEALYNMSVEA